MKILFQFKFKIFEKNNLNKVYYFLIQNLFGFINAKIFIYKVIPYNFKLYQNKQ